jgi:hypothetical protein
LFQHSIIPGFDYPLTTDFHGLFLIAPKRQAFGLYLALFAALQARDPIRFYRAKLSS